MRFTKITVFILLFGFGQLLFGQQNFTNNLNRIDSLTKQYMNEIPLKACNSLCIDGFSPANKSFFEQQMHSLGSEISFTYNEAVHGQLKYFSYNDASFLCRAMINKNKYFPIFEETLDKYNLPQELKYISIIESALNPNAKSRAGAMGLWQFMPGTGKYLDLTINAKIDDRRSIKASTEKAAEYFRDLHAMFGDWLLAIAAYNAGPGNVRRAISNAGGVADFWYISRFLPKETQNYVPRFIAATYLMNFSTHIQGYNGDNYPVYCGINIADTMEFEQLCKFTGIELEEAQNLNSQFRMKALKGDANNIFELLLPYDQAMSFLENQDSIYYYSKNPIIFTAEISDSTFNPGLETENSIAEKLVPKNNGTRNFSHHVKRGETLYFLSKKYNVSQEDIRKWNKMSSNHIRVGQEIIIKRQS